ncbi:MAG TPA: DUF3261 domain-containing protein [Gallionella sp.]|nr:DUF3261 domain-containing protein [Gallionella sp.]
MRKFFILVLSLFLGACAGVQKHPAQVELPLPKLSPASFNGAVSLTQRLSFERTGVESGPGQVIEAMLEIDDSDVRLAGFALGQRILTLHWDGHALTSERHPQLPQTVDADRVLRDVQYAYWPMAAIRTVLPQDWSLDDEAGVRILRYQGKPMLLVHYSVEPRWQGRAELDNILEGYRLTIESSELGDAP